MKKVLIALLFSFIGVICFSQSQLEMNQQALKAYQKADAEMTTVYKKVLKKLEDPIQKKALLEAQKVWIKYKEAHCKAIADLYEGGSMQPMVYSDCLETLTKERTKNLKTYLEND